MFPWGPERPTGQRWEIAGLAQILGTCLTAIQLALRVMAKIPPTGAVIVATTNSDKPLRQYCWRGSVAVNKGHRNPAASGHPDHRGVLAHVRGACADAESSP